MPTIIAERPQTIPHSGKTCTVLRSITVEDGELFDVKTSKSVVALDDGTEVIVQNIELQF